MTYRPNYDGEHLQAALLIHNGQLCYHELWSYAIIPQH